MSVDLVTRESNAMQEYDSIKPFLISPRWSEIAQSEAKMLVRLLDTGLDVEGLPVVE